MLADRGAFLDLVPVSPNGDTVVPRVNQTVGHGYKLAGVDINTVCVGSAAGIEHLNSSHLHIGTAQETAAPAGAVLQRHIRNPHPGAFHHHQHLPRPQILLILC